MANPLQIRFIATANTAPLVTGLNAIRTAAQGSMAGVSTSVVQVQAPLNKLTADIQKGRLSWNDYRRSLRSANAIIAENNAIMRAKAVAFKTATGSAKVHMTVIRGTAASYATLGQQMRFAVTATRAFGKQMIATGKNIQWAGRQVMVGLTLPIMALGFATSKLAEEYNKQMTRIVKVTNLSRVTMQDEFGKMKEIYQAGITDPKVMNLAIKSIERQSGRLLDLGASMGFAAAETSKMAAEFSQMGFAGVHLDGLTESALRLARVSGADLPDAMNLTRLAAMAFGKTLGEGHGSLIETFAKLNLIENQTSLSLAEMAGAIPIVAGVAKNLGIDIDKLGGLLALMKDKGIEAREGATSLRTGLIRLVQDATDPAIKAFDKLGISITDLQEKHKGDVFGLINELAGTLHELQNSTEGARQKTDEFIAAIGKMVGTRAAARFTSMLEGIGKDIEQYTVMIEGQETTQYRFIEGIDQTSDAYRALSPAIVETNRAILQFRYEEERVNSSLAGQAEIIRAQLNVQLVRMGEKFLPLRNKIMGFIVSVLEGFNRLSDTVRNFISVTVGIFAVLGPVTMLFGVFANAVGQILVLMTRLFPTFKFTTMAMAAEQAAFSGNTAAVNAAAAAKQAMVHTNTALVASTHSVTAAITAQNAALAGAAMGGRGAGRAAGARASRIGVASREHGGIAVASSSVRGTQSHANKLRETEKKLMAEDKSMDPVMAGIIAASMFPGMTSVSAMRAGLSEQRILQMLPQANAELMKQRFPGQESLIQQTRQNLAKDAAAAWEQDKGGKTGGRRSQARFLQEWLTPYRVEQALLSAGINDSKLPQTAREIAGLPQRMSSRDIVHLSKEQRALLNSKYGIRIGGRASIGQIESAAIAATGHGSAARMEVERMVDRGQARATYANVSDRQIVAQDRGYAARQAQSRAASGELGTFANDDARKAAIRAEEQRLLKETNRGRSAYTGDSRLKEMQRRIAMAGSRFDQSKEVFKGKMAPQTDFQKGLATGRNAALAALMLFPKLLLSPYTLLKSATVGLITSFFGLKTIIGAVVKIMGFVTATRAALSANPLGIASLGKAVTTFAGNQGRRVGRFSQILAGSAMGRAAASPMGQRFSRVNAMARSSFASSGIGGGLRRRRAGEPTRRDIRRDLRGERGNIRKRLQDRAIRRDRAAARAGNLRAAARIGRRELRRRGIAGQTISGRLRSAAASTGIGGGLRRRRAGEPTRRDIRRDLRGGTGRGDRRISRLARDRAAARAGDLRAAARLGRRELQSRGGRGGPVARLRTRMAGTTLGGMMRGRSQGPFAALAKPLKDFKSSLIAAAVSANAFAKSLLTSAARFPKMIARGVGKAFNKAARGPRSIFGKMSESMERGRVRKAEGLGRPSVISRARARFSDKSSDEKALRRLANRNARAQAKAEKAASGRRIRRSAPVMPFPDGRRAFNLGIPVQSSNQMLRMIEQGTPLSSKNTRLGRMRGRLSSALGGTALGGALRRKRLGEPSRRDIRRDLRGERRSVRQRLEERSLRRDRAAARMGDTKASRRLGERELARRAGRSASLRTIMPRTDIFSKMNSSFSEMIKRIRATNISLAAMTAAVKRSTAVEALRGLGMKGIGGRALQAIKSPFSFAKRGMAKVSSAWTSSAAANAGAVSSRGLFRQAGQQMGSRIFKDPYAARSGMGRVLSPVDRFRRGYDKSMRRAGERQWARSGQHGPMTPELYSKYGRKGATAGQKARAAGRGVMGLAGGALKFAAGAFTGAGLAITIPLLISFGAAAAANPEQFKKNMMKIFKQPLEALKKTWDDATSAIRRLFVALRTGTDGDGSKFVAFAGKATGIIGTVFAGAFQSVLGIVTFLTEALHALFMLMSGDGDAASEIFSTAMLRIRVVMAEVLASFLELLSTIPGIGKLFEGGAERLREWAAETREQLEYLDMIPNMIAETYRQQQLVANAVKKTNEERSEAKAIIEDLLKFQILQQETYDDLIKSVQNATLLETARLEASEDQAWTVREEFMAREDALDAVYNQIAAMDMLTDEQKTQLAYLVAYESLQQEAAVMESHRAELMNLMEKLRRGEVENVNLEKQKTLALLYLEAELVEAVKDGDTDRVAAIRAQAREIINQTDDQIAGNEILAVYGQEAERHKERILKLGAEVNKQIAHRIQLSQREQAEYDAIREELEDGLDNLKNWWQAFRSAMGEVMGDIGSAVQRIVGKQTDAIKKLFDDIEEVTKDYFSNFSEQFKNAIDELREAIQNQAEEEERIINELADLAIQKIEDERELEAKLERERQRYFAREKARIDFLSGRRAGTIQVEEAFARGDIGQAALLQIRMQVDAEQYYIDQLQENENRLAEIREEARQKETEKINDERDLALEIVAIRRENSEAELDAAEDVVMTQMDLAKQAADERISQAKDAVAAILEREDFLRNEFMRNFNRITPASEAEARERLAILEAFLNESDARVAGEINKIKNQMGQDLAEISNQFGFTVEDVVDGLTTAIDASGFAIGEFSNKLLLTTTNTLMSVLTAFDGFNNGLQQGYANASALAQSFMEMFQRDITEAVAWARNLANIMVGEDGKWAEAGEAAADAFARPFEERIRRIMENAEARIRDAETRANRIAPDSHNAIFRGLMAGGDWENIWAGHGTGSSWYTPPSPATPTAPAFVPGTYQQMGKLGSTLTFVPGQGATRSWEGSGIGKGEGSGLTLLSNAATRGVFNVVDTLSLLGKNFRQNFSWQGDGTPTIYHTGGLVGDSLKSDEVSAVLQKGEYVIQKRAVSALGVDFLNSLNNSSAMFSVPQMRNLNIEPPGTSSTVNSTATYNLSFNVDGGNIDEQKLAQKVVFEIKKMERAGGGGRRI